MAKKDEKLITELKKSKEHIQVLKTLFKTQLKLDELKKSLKIKKSKIVDSLAFLKKNDLISEHYFNNVCKYCLNSNAVFIMVVDFDIL